MAEEGAAPGDEVVIERRALYAYAVGLNKAAR